MAYKSDKYVNDVQSSDESDEEQVYEPPRHYKQVKLDKPVDIEDDKQIWLIKYPKQLDLSQVKSLPISFADSTGVFSNNNDNYEIKEQTMNPEDNKYSVFVNDKNGGYTKTSTKINRFYNIGQTLSIPDINYHKVKKPRKNVPQVKNLKMRYFPTGYNQDHYEEAKGYDDDNDDDGDNNDDDDDDNNNNKNDDISQPSEQQLPKKLKEEKKKKKEKKDKKDKKEKKKKD